MVHQVGGYIVSHLIHNKMVHKGLRAHQSVQKAVFSEPFSEGLREAVQRLWWTVCTTLRYAIVYPHTWWTILAPRNVVRTSRSPVILPGTARTECASSGRFVLGKKEHEKKN